MPSCSLWPAAWQGPGALGRGCYLCPNLSQGPQACQGPALTWDKRGAPRPRTGRPPDARHVAEGPGNPAFVGAAGHGGLRPARGWGHRSLSWVSLCVATFQTAPSQEEGPGASHPGGEPLGMNGITR